MEDKEAIYDEQIAPLMTQLLEICRSGSATLPLLPLWEKVAERSEVG